MIDIFHLFRLNMILIHQTVLVQGPRRTVGLDPAQDQGWRTDQQDLNQGQRTVLRRCPKDCCPCTRLRRGKKHEGEVLIRKTLILRITPRGRLLMLC